MKINAAITISRHHGNREGKIGITIRDEKSRIQFVDAEIGLSDFAEALTGLAEVPVNAEVRGLEFVGKVKVREDRSIVCPLACYDREKLSQWLRENAKEEGWMIDDYLGSKGSTESHEKGQLLRYAVFKFVDEGPPSAQKDTKA